MDYLQTAIDTARAAGALIRDIYRQGPQEIRHKSSAVDLVTEADMGAQDLVTRRLREAFPDHGIWAEEGNQGRPDSAAFWLLDPLDGTTNFAHRFPVFAVSLALVEAERIRLAVVLDVVRDRCYWAEAGAGAWCEGRRLQVSSTVDLGRALLATGFPYNRASTQDNNLWEFNYFMPRCQGVRRAGAAALDLAWVAEGCLDGYWEAQLNPWDWAAGVLLIGEAGGRVSTYDGNPWTLAERRLVASNGQSALHTALLAGIQAARSGQSA